MNAIHRLAPATPATSLVILFHGYGADGRDLIDLGGAWRAALPHAAFVAPDAPTPCEIGGSGFQWWSLSHGISADFGAAALDSITPAVLKFIEEERVRANVPHNKIALVGFSQGCMLTLHMALRCTDVAAVLGYSGCYLPAASPVINTPPALLVHGLMDAIVPYAWMEPSAHALRQQRVPVETITRPMLSHSIDAEGISAGGTFLAKHLA